LFIFLKFSWIKLAKFMIKQYYKSIEVKRRKQDVIAFVNTVTQVIHRGRIYGIHVVINYFPNQQIHENFLTTVTIWA
jgi:hypothetical protein